MRHQLTVLQRQGHKPRLKGQDLVFWVVLKRTWPKWRTAVMIFQPETVIAWQRAGFRLFWRGKSGRRSGRPGKDPELVRLIRQMWTANPTWGSPRIRDELAKLGLHASTATIRKYRPKSRHRPSQGWRTFLRNHAGTLAAMDFLVVPTVTCRLLYVLLVITHERRKVVHFNITEAPTGEWTAQQVINAFPYDIAPSICSGPGFDLRGGLLPTSRGHGHQAEAHHAALALAIALRGALDRLHSPRMPRRMIILHERQLYQALQSYLEYYHHVRPHRSLNHDSPVPRSVQAPDSGKVIELPLVGGLHHHYLRRAA